MTDLQALILAFAVPLLAAIGLAFVTGRTVLAKIGRALAVCALILLMLFLAWPGGR